MGVSSLIVLALATGLLVAVPTVAGADEVTVSSDVGRTGPGPNEPGLSPSSVQPSDFGKIFSTKLNGQVYAQPITAGGTLIAATENNNVYGLDPVSGAIKWSVNLGPSWPVSTIG